MYGHHEADLRLCFRICKKNGFSYLMIIKGYFCQLAIKCKLWILISSSSFESFSNEDGRNISVISDAAWYARGTTIDPHALHILS